MKTGRRRVGFSLSELLIVTAIILILMTLGIVGWSTSSPTPPSSSASTAWSRSGMPV